MRRLALLALSLAGCGSPAPVVPADMRALEASADPLQWQAGGYVELTAPIRPPTSADETARIVVYLALPTGASIVDGRVPDGTTAARVEYTAPTRDPDAHVSSTWRVLDVRAFAWRDGQRECSVLRPGKAGRLVGLAWPCSEENDRRAGAILGEVLHAGPKAARHVARINGCTHCHAADRAEDRRPGVLVQRGTDASGLVTPAAVFRDDDAAERYRPVDSNRADPLVTPTCPDSTVTADPDRCADGRWSRRHYDLEGGMRRGSVHAQRVCASRRALAALTAAPLTASMTAALARCVDSRHERRSAP